MFGHQDDKDDSHHDDSQQDDSVIAPDIAAEQPAGDATDDAAGQDHNDQAAPSDNDDNGQGGDSDTSQQDGQTAKEGDDSWQHPSEPVDDGAEQISDIISPAGGHHPNPAPPMPTAPRHSSDDNDDDNDGANVPHELIDIKQKALTQLAPMMDQLDLGPEDKFRTTMMMIQASDDQGLIQKAYDAAEAIEDEKVRAQALLDIVNEINYFTQHPVAEN